MLELNKIYHGDCFELIEQIPDKSVDMIIEDMPYGTTACKWDQGKISEDQKLFLKWFDDIPFSITFQNERYLFYWEMVYNFIEKLFKLPIDLAEYWQSRNRIIKDNGVIVLTASQPFTSLLVMSNLKMFKYEWIWYKNKSGNTFLYKISPMKRTENILVFINGVIIPQNEPNLTFNHSAKIGNKLMKTVMKNVGVQNSGTRKDSAYKKYFGNTGYCDNVLKYNIDPNGIHSTQKPVALFGYLIKTYTNEGNLVIDGFAGSGTTGIACLKTKRNFICIEKDLVMFKKAERRIKTEQSKLTLF